MKVISARTVLVSLVCGAVLPASAATRRVPSEHPTINQGLDASATGDTVLVAPGVYDQFETRLLGDGFFFSSVAFLKGGVTLLSEAGASQTVLRMDATVAGPIVLRAFGQVGTATVEGFTVTGTVQGIRGMSYTFGERCVVRDCVFRDLGTGGTDQLALGGTMSDLEA